MSWIEENFEKLRDACALDGIRIKMTEGLRTHEVQRAYYAQGRESLLSVNKHREIAGLSPIDEDTNKRKITWTINSKHIAGEAFDIVYIDESGKANWTDKAKYERIAEIGTDLGLKAGYYFKHSDGPHFEKP